MPQTMPQTTSKDVEKKEKTVFTVKDFLESKNGEKHAVRAENKKKGK